MSSLFSKIVKGFAVFGKTLYQGLMMSAEGAMLGAEAGPVGIALGAVGGAIAGVAMNGSSIYNFLKDAEEPSIKSTTEKIRSGQSDAAIAYAITNPDDPSSAVVRKTLDGVKAGGTWRSSYIAAGGHQFGRAISDGQIQGLINKAAGELGVSPITAMAHGNGAYRSLISKVGPNSAHFHGVNNAIMGSAHPVAGAAIANSGMHPRGLIRGGMTQSGVSAG